MHVSTTPLVGRELPLRQLIRALDEAAAGIGRLVLISGEPGVGKSSIASAVLAEAERRGDRTATGVCWDGAGAPGLWPWVQALRTLRSAVGPDEWKRAGGPGHGALDRLIDSVQFIAASTVEFHLFDAVLQLLQGLARTRPVVLLLEDLQWADAASVQLLEFVQRHTGHIRLLLVSTYRTDELAHPGHPRRDAIAELARAAAAIVLGGLNNVSIKQLRDQLGAATTLAEAEHIRRLTGGNPFFVIESAAYTSLAGSLGVQRAIDHRIDALSDLEREVMTVASVVGRTVPDAVVMAVVGDRTTCALATITAAGLMYVDGDSHSFVHDLIREAISRRLPIDERRAVHAAIVRASATGGAAATLLPAQIAWQATQAIPDIPAGFAVELLKAAALDATARMTHEAAGRHLEEAAALSVDRLEFIRLTLASGRAYLRGGELGHAHDRFAALLEESPDVRARALLGLHSLGEEAASRTMTDVVRGLDEVHAALGPDIDAALRAQVLASRARRSHRSGDASQPRRPRGKARGRARSAPRRVASGRRARGTRPSSQR